MSGETLRLSVADAAARLGVSVDTIRRRLKRGQLQAQRDNSGKQWVLLPPEAAASAAPTPRAAYAPMQQEQNILIEELRRQAEWLRSEIERQRVEHQAIVARLQAERDDERSQHQQQVERFQAERAALIEHQRYEHDRLRVDHAAEITRLQQIIVSTAPWWRRLRR